MTQTAEPCKHEEYRVVNRKERRARGIKFSPVVECLKCKMLARVRENIPGNPEAPVAPEEKHE